MDEKDLQILQLLEENSRIPTADLATMTELSEDDVRARIAGMEDARIIRGYSTVVDWERAGNGEVLAIIDLKVTPERDFGYERIAGRIAGFRQVRSLRLVTGMYDLQLLVTGRTMQEVARFVSEQIAPMDHIRETATHLVMKVYKENGTLFVEREGAERLPFSF
ncbi:MAG: Lrp/AsnC family transcriptional regulator [Methanomicrobiales archaeon]|nr:Lrp/AsnC family transcriptional regulator [Methanomicrobiales archaeon]